MCRRISGSNPGILPNIVHKVKKTFKESGPSLILGTKKVIHFLNLKLYNYKNAPTSCFPGSRVRRGLIKTAPTWLFPGSASVQMLKR